MYNIFITPLEIIIENIFSFFYYNLQLSIGCTIFYMSFFISLLCLPLYCRADRICKEEEAKLSELEPYINKIKRNFKGDEKFFLLKTLYRQHGYNPIGSLRNTFSLLMQIPFFIAAYHFFSNLELLNNHSLWLIKDLSMFAEYQWFKYKCFTFYNDYN